MLKKELKELLRNGENTEIEFKRDNLRPEQLAKEIVAFANSYGGRVLIGIEDTGEVTGVRRDKLEEWIMDVVCGRYIHPIIIPKYEEIQWSDKKRVAIISILAGIAKPYVLRYNNREDIYIRTGSISRLASREQIIRLSAAGGMLSVETLPVSGSEFSFLDLVRIENYFMNILLEPVMPKSDTELVKRLEYLGFMTKTNDQGSVCTIAGLLLFGINPRRYLKNSGIRLIVFDSKEKEYRAKLDVLLEGPMVGRWNIDKSQPWELIDEGIVEKTAAVLYPFITQESDEIDKHFRREINLLYPWTVIRELILNALIHRDLTRSIEIEIIRYEDRIEIVSPGALPNSMTIEKMIGGRRTPRNQLIVEVMRDYRYVDARGMGIRNKVIPELMKFNGTQPMFEVTDDYLKTTIFAGSSRNDPKSDPDKPIFDPNLSTDDKIMTLIKQNPEITYEQLAMILNTSTSTIKRNIQKLKTREMILRKGSMRKGYWKILKIEESE
jgi:ATP-dependent DNA helicase RecG